MNNQSPRIESKLMQDSKDKGTLMMIKKKKKNLFKMASKKNVQFIKLYATTSFRRMKPNILLLIATFIVTIFIIFGNNLILATNNTTTIPPQTQYSTLIAFNQSIEQETSVKLQDYGAANGSSTTQNYHNIAQNHNTTTLTDQQGTNSQQTQKSDTNHLAVSTQQQQQQQQQQVTSEQTVSNVSGASSLPQSSSQVVTKAVPVLRPSIEEVASKLSRKHLNLEHENWRLKASSSQVDQFQVGDSSVGGLSNDGSLMTETTVVEGPVNGGELTVEAEQEIKMSPPVATTNSSVSQQHLAAQVRESVFKKSTTDGRSLDYNLHIDVTSGINSQSARNNNKQPQVMGATATTGNWRRKKGGTVFQQNHYEDNELFQCHQYLQYHSSPQTQSNGISSSPIVNAGLSRLVSSQLLPCSCDSRRRHIAEPPTSALDSTWLSCDNVQLMGSHFYIPTPNFNSFNNNNNNNNNHDNNTNNNNNSTASNGSSQNNNKVLLVTKFSQRDSGLQTLHAQKFHYLQLFHLKSIDLSNNRIRLIQMDAFHGLENKLEFLNLANNLLGDSRALSNDKLIFTSDELNRLRKLKWLSLHNNQINQLGPTIFYKSTTTTSSSGGGAGGGVGVGAATTPTTNANTDTLINDQLSELSYLDLSENLLNFIPSESIYQLNELKTLKLSKNRISQLNQFSKFPKSLRYLDLSENLIRTIRQCDLIDLPNLIELNLSRNQLSHLDKNAFISSTTHLGNSLLLTPTDSSSAFQQHHNNHDLSRVSSSWDFRLQAAAAAAAANADAEGEIIMDGAHQLQTDGRHPVGRYERNTDEIEELEATFDDGEAESGDDLEMGESIMSSITNQVSARQTLNEESNSIQHFEQFNSTLKLDLSYNLFENIPGDSLLKFTNLQQLDLSYNRIRKLDSNYFCSIYNLVENLRYLDLSGNLLSITGQQNNTSSANGGSNSNENGKHLNKLFGCLLRLEKLLLSTNRLAAVELPASGLGSKEFEQNYMDSGMPVSSGSLQDDYVDQMTSDSNLTEQFVSMDGNRLIMKFGEGFGSRHLNTLDLSDNQLNHVPLIEQVVPNPIQSLNITNLSSHQTHLNQWINSRMYLEVLNLNYNSIERLEEQDFEHLFNLRQLYLDFNKLSSLPIKLMRRFTSLDRLSLEGNSISSLSSFNELFERSGKTLRFLNLANNRLTEWPQLIRSSSLSPSSSDKQQKISLNQDDPHESIGFSLEELNLEGNQLTSENVTSLFDQLLYMKSLKSLNLNYNLLSRVRSEWFKFANRNLQTLSLTGNKINTIDLGSFAWNQVNELIQLNLDNNLLRELKRKTFDSLPKLRELNLANNLIHTINSETFHQVNSLEILKLNNNKLTSWKCEYFSNLCNPTSGAINADLASLLGGHSASSVNHHHQQQQQQTFENPPSTVSSLIELDLSHNSLSQLRTNSIAVHTKLVKLNLSHNKLSFIPHDLFKATTSGLITGRQILLVSSIKYLNLAHNNIQTIDNINFRPLKNLLSLDLSFNELQTLGVDVILLDQKSIQLEQNNRRVIISSNLTNLPASDEIYSFNRNETTRQSRSGLNNGGGVGGGGSGSGSGSRMMPPATNWPALSKLRHLNVANNQLTLVNQSLISELSPFALLNLNLSFNYLDSESLPYGFYSKITGAAQSKSPSAANTNQEMKTNFDLVFTLKLESLDLSHNKLNEFPTNLLDNHYTSIESCNLAHNMIQNLVANSNLMLQIKSLDLGFNPLNRESNELVLFEQRSVRYLNLAATRLYAIQQATIVADSPISNSGGFNAQLKYRLVNQTSQLDLIRSISKPINAPYLRHLNLSSNQLVWLAANVFDRMHSLQVLDLSNNQLTRLHLLNNQLMHVSSSLEYLNMGSNLFTSIDSNDFNQLSKLRHLDLSNLLSLQKMNCKFMSKLNSLKTLRMFNYPQLRQNINNLLVTIASSGVNSGEASSIQADRIQRKLINELIMSSIGRHCFQDDVYTNEGDLIQNPLASVRFNLEHLELELFNNFWGKQEISGGGFRLRDELSQLLGPQLKALVLFGLNLTSLSDDSLFGITNEELKLKISYTSMTQLPLRQLLYSLAKRTKLKLDFRNNNIQSIDTRSLQLLDELQLNNQILQRGDHSTLRLSSNPIRCDCQTRPLWLWLNQRWATTLMIDPSGSSADESLMLDISTQPTPTAATNYWAKFKSLINTSDLRCYYPLKLRGKPTQHVNYNDLICKGAQQPIVTIRQSPSSSSSKKRNETRPSDSYYITSASSSSGAVIGGGGGGVANGDLSDGDDGIDEDDYLDLAESKLEPTVRVTKFNKFPVNYEINQQQQLWTSSGVLIPEESSGKLGSEFGSLDDSRWSNSRRDRREQVLSGEMSENNKFESGLINQQVNINYNKHRPNIHQRHSHYDTVSQLNSGTRTQHLKVSGASGGSNPSNSATKHSWLTDVDVIILTVSSVAMILMSFIILIACLFTNYQKLDESGKEQILETQKKFLLTQAILMNKKKLMPNMEPGGLKQIANGSSFSSSESKKSKNSQAAADSKQQQPLKAKKAFIVNNMKTNGTDLSTANKQLKAHNSKHSNAQNPHQNAQNQVLIPMNPAVQGLLSPVANTDNFLMRSPTIRRMHGFATNASDWFKFTLRAYPSNNAAINRRRHLLIGKSVPTGSQLTTAQMASNSQFDNNSKLLASAMPTACPIHAFKSIQKLTRPEPGVRAKSMAEEQCLHCLRLLAATKRTKVNYVIGGSGAQKPQDETSSSSNASLLLAQEANKRTCLNDEMGHSDESHQQDQYYLMPKQNKAAAAVSNQQQQHHRLQDSDLNSQQQPGRLIGNRREQRNRPLRTFGSSNPATSFSQIIGERTNNIDDITTSGTHIPSQIPTVDIEGRFAYQSDSNFDSPACLINSRQGSRPDTRAENRTSSLVGEQEMFILVHDSQGSSSDINLGSQTLDSSARLSVGGLTDRGRISDTLINEFNSMMNDECSHSSSPVAYGFMRSSPSATTLSSVTHTQTNHCISSSLNTTNQNSLRGYTHMNNNNQTKIINNNNNNNNNNNTGYWKHRNEDEEETDITPRATTTTTTDEQIIISRL